MKDFKGKVAVITGGASGVGRAIGERLGREGARLVLADIERGALDKTVAEMATQGIEAIGHVTDVTKFDSVQALVERSFDHYGAVHLLFNNAGVGPGEAMTLWDTDLNTWAWGFNVNVWGVVHGLKAFMPRLVAQNQEAHVINTTSSNGGLYMLPNTPVYAATKAAVSAMTEVLHFQLQGQGSPVKVSCLFPGPHIVRTGLFNSDRVRPADLPADPNRMDLGIRTAEDLQTMMANFGMNIEITTPEEVAEYVYQGLLKDDYWILPQTEKSKTALRARMEGMLNNITPTVPDVL
jgi:NAD(P)-dependent dehydrogenase (short-subunit alcohol dehydrogenase family)